MTCGPLAGVRVLDFTWVGAGPLTTKLLADFGADVIKIESRLRPDPLRKTPPFKDKIEGLERSGYFANRNSSKRSLALNMAHPQARGIALELAAASDICAQSFRPGTMEKWDLGYEDLAAVRPDIIYLSMPMQGETGPQASYSGFGATLVALSGLYALCGEPDYPPTGTGTNYPDHVPNPMHAAFAVLVALRHRLRTGEGQRVELSQLESTVNIIGPALLATMGGNEPSRIGNASTYAAPHGVYPCTGVDRWVAITVDNDVQWKRLVATVGLDEWRDPAFERAPYRLENRARLDAELAKWTSKQSDVEVMERLQGAGVPAGIVADAQDVVEDPQLNHRGAFVWQSHPEIGRSLYSAPTPKLSRDPGAVHRPAPLLGEHTNDICRDLLGWDIEKIQQLRDEGVLQ